VQNELAGLILTQEASYKEREGVQKMAQRQTSKASGSSKSAAKNLLILLGPTFKKTKK
jgi:hypothetical protein